MPSENAATAVCKRPLTTARERERISKYSSGVLGQTTPSGSNSANNDFASGVSMGSLQATISLWPSATSVRARLTRDLNIARPRVCTLQNCRLLDQKRRGGTVIRIWPLLLFASGRLKMNAAGSPIIFAFETPSRCNHSKVITSLAPENAAQSLSNFISRFAFAEG